MKISIEIKASIDEIMPNFDSPDPDNKIYKFLFSTYLLNLVGDSPKITLDDVSSLLNVFSADVDGVSYIF